MIKSILTQTKSYMYQELCCNTSAKTYITGWSKIEFGTDSNLSVSVVKPAVASLTWLYVICNIGLYYNKLLISGILLFFFSIFGYLIICNCTSYIPLYLLPLKQKWIFATNTKNNALEMTNLLQYWLMLETFCGKPRCFFII